MEGEEERGQQKGQHLTARRDKKMMDWREEEVEEEEGREGDRKESWVEEKDEMVEGKGWALAGTCVVAGGSV